MAFASLAAMIISLPGYLDPQAAHTAAASAAATGRAGARERDALQVTGKHTLRGTQAITGRRPRLPRDGSPQTLVAHRQPQIGLSVFDNPVLAERLADRAALLADKPDRTHGRGYYTAFALRITADQGQAELGDDGFTT